MGAILRRPGHTKYRSQPTHRQTERLQHSSKGKKGEKKRDSLSLSKKERAREQGMGGEGGANEKNHQLSPACPLVTLASYIENQPDTRTDNKN